MMMECSVNYSMAAGELQKAGQLGVDRFKCPAWPDLVAQVQADFPLYVHFPLRTGRGDGMLVDTETKQAVDWNKIETLLTQTETPLVNVHLAATAVDYPDLSLDTTNPDHVAMITEGMIQDVMAAVQRFGKENVILENVPGMSRDNTFHCVSDPAVISQVVEETGCGLLFDISHARLAAYHREVDVYDYIESLPLAQIREVHVTGIQVFEGHWLALAQKLDVPTAVTDRFAGQLLDHLPMTTADWPFLEWMMTQIHNGRWGQPWIVSFEYGGVGHLFEAVTDKATLAEQVPRICQIVKSPTFAPNQI